MKLLIPLFTLILVSTAAAQPNTEVYLFDLQRDDQNNYTIENPLNISNNPGYDNQPTFWSEGNSILYARTVDGQTEIARYFIGSGKTVIVSKTLQGSEYSPTPTPDGRISSIRLDTTGLQLLYAYDLKGGSEVLVEDLVIGYHTWLDKTRLAAFVLGEPNTLQIIDTKNGSSKIVAASIGRSLHRIPDSREMSYVDKSGENWVIKALNPKNGKERGIVGTKEGAEDYCWTPGGELLLGQNTLLWAWNPVQGWRQVIDVSTYGLQGITRVAVSPDGDKLALVVNN